MHLSHLWPLAFLLIIPVLWFIHTRTLTNFNRRQSMLQTAVRSALLVFLVLALAQPIVYRAARSISVVYAVDVSDSVASDSITAAAAWIDQANRAGRPDDSRIVAFGRNGVPVGTSDELRQIARTRRVLTASASSGDAPLDTSATNLEAALTHAWRTFAPNHLMRLVLISDGRETEGGVHQAVARMARQGIRIFTLPAQPVARRDAWVERVRTRDVVVAAEPFHVDIDVFSQMQTIGTLEIRQQGQFVASRDLRLVEGANHAVLDARLDREGAAMLDVSWRSPGDTVAANNELRVPVFVRSPKRVLYVEGRPQSAHYLKRALDESGFAVDLRAPADIPVDAAGFAPYSAVIVSDVPRSALSDRNVEALTAFISQLGGGFIMVGGESVFGVKGYAGSEIERVLPVTFSAKEDPEDVAVVIVLDKSWSMAGPFIELSKEAAKAAVDVLNDRHQIGVVTFNDSFDWPVPLQSAANRREIKDRISTIVPSSHTNIYPALQAAGQELRESKAKTRHVILLSDGQTYPDEYERLVTSMAEAKITVSTVAVGTEADRVLLGNIARWGQGRAYMLENASDVPQIFMKEVENTARQALVEKPLTPVVKKRVGMFAGLDLAKAPALKGYSSTQAKDTAETLLETPTGDPLLARWHYGLGRTAIFTSDVKDRWAVDWLRWPGYGKFWSQLVRDLTAGVRPDSTLTVRREGAEGRIAIDAFDEAGLPRDLLSPRVEIRRWAEVLASGSVAGTSASGGVTETPASSGAAGGTGEASASSQGPPRAVLVDLHQTGPGRYEATVPLSQKDDYLVRLVNDQNTQKLEVNASSFILPSSYPEELRARPPDEALLHAISAETGGAFQPAPVDIFARQDELATTPVRLWRLFAGLALALWLTDILLRRVRIFEPV